MSALLILGAALLTYAVCVSAGQLLLARLKLKLDRSEYWFFGFLLGSACLSTLVFLLAVLHWIYPWVLGALGGVIILARCIFRSSPRHEFPGQGAPMAWRILFWAVYLAYGVYYLGAAMQPEISPDGMGYHVGLLTRYFDRHGFYALPNNLYANLPGGIEMVFLYAFAFGRHSAAAMAHLLYLLALPFGIHAYARRMGQPAIGIVASLLFYAAPVVGIDGTSAYVDVAAAAAVFGSFHLLQIWMNESRLTTLVAAGLLAGFSFATKYTAAGVVIYAVALVFIASRQRKERPWRPLATVLAPALIVASPWALKNIAYVANPLYPFLNRFFPNPYFSEMAEQSYRAGLAHMNDVSYLALPWQITAGGTLTGIIGPVFLLAPLALLGLRSPIGRRVLPAFLVVVLPYFGNIGTRFLIPSLPFLALALAAGLTVIPGLRAMALAAHLILSWPSMIPVWAPPYQWSLSSVDWRAAIRMTPEEAFLEGHLHSAYRAGLMLDRYVPPDQLVYSPSFGLLSYQHRDLVGFWESSLGHRISSMLILAMESFVSDKIQGRRFVFQPLQAGAIRLDLSGVRGNELQLSELRFFRDKEELPRSPQWRLSASDNPWDVQLAFDGNPASWWNSSRDAGMRVWLQVDFGNSREITSVTVEQPANRSQASVRILARTAAGWAPVSAREEPTSEPGMSDIRRDVSAAMKASGVRWVLLRDDEVFAEDFRQFATHWGARQVAREEDFRLWKLE